jgi:hypothetical protein
MSSTGDKVDNLMGIGAENGTVAASTGLDPRRREGRPAVAMAARDSLRAKALVGAVATLTLVVFVAANVTIALFVEFLADVRWTPRLQGLVIVWILFYVLTDVLRHMLEAARDWIRQDPACPDLVTDPFKFVGRRASKELLRAADLGGRCTVAALLWSLLYFAVRDNILADAASLSRLTDNYINVALLVGPVVGLVWWAAEWEYRQGLLREDRTQDDGTSGGVDAERRRRFLASAEPVAGVLGSALFAGLVTLLFL